MAKLICCLIFSYVMLHARGVFAIPTKSNGKTITDLQAEDISRELNAVSNSSVEVSYDYLISDLGNHKIHTAQKKSWNDARNTCLNEGAHLAVINSAAEEAIILEYMRKQNLTQGIWIGMHELFKKDEWVSVKDERFDAIGYAHWRKGEPNNAGDNEHCVVIGYQGMNDVNCDTELFFVCEI